MRKIFTLVVLFVLAQQFVKAQVVTSDRTFNFLDVAAYEAAHPELFKPCPTCPRREADEGINTTSSPAMPFPPGATIKMSAPIPKKGPYVPDVPSRAPSQNWLGHVDVGSIIPPDTYGAVGLNHVMTATNNFVKIHAKVGGAQISQVTISSFTGVGTTCDPQVFFDPNAQRWIFVAIGCAGNGNPVILMTSNTSDPTGTWRVITFVPLPTGLLDHPYLGYDDTKIVIGGRKFNSASGPDIYLFVKSDMMTGVPIVFGGNAQTITRTAADGDCPRPVTVYFPPFSNSGNPSPGTVYIVQSWNNTSLRLTTVTGNIPTCVWNTGAAVFPTAPGAEAWTSGGQDGGSGSGAVPQFPPPPPPTGTNDRIAANDARISSAVMMNGKIWCSQHCAFPAGATGSSVTHIDAQYWKLEGNPGGTFGDVLQRGRTGAVPGQFRWFSSIAVNKNEDVLLGYSMSTINSMWPSAGYSTRQLTTPVNTMDDPLVFHAGEDSYWKDFGSGRTRWGDYSNTHLDPVDNSLWTTQQYASLRIAGSPPNNSRFGTWWAQVPPSTPTLAPVITAGTATLTAEGCVPNNGVIDPGEVVTVSFCVTNTGTAPTVNLVGTMQASGGVTPISGPQNYGILVNGGPAVCRSFSFTNTSSICGATITVSIQFQDGATNLGTSTWVFTLGTTVVSSSQNFDAVVAPALPAGWVATLVQGPAPTWVTSNAGTPAPPAASAPNALFVDDPAVISDKQITTPSFIPGGAARVSFANNYALESTYDGGVLEISINGGPFQDIITAGGSFVAGGYTNVISTSFGNPIGGRMAWSGSSGTFITTTINMPPASAGQPCVLKFRMCSDNSVSAVGWRVDNFSVSQPACCGAACTITCPPNQTVNSSATQCGANVTFPPATTTGLCGLVTYVPANGSFFPVGTTTVTATAAAGPSCTFTVTVVDNVAPVVTCPANITRNNDPGLCSAVVNYSLPTVRDNCDPPPIQFPASFQAHGGGQVYSLQGNTLPGGLFYTLTNNTASSRTINSFGIRFGDPAFGAVIAPQTLTIWSRPGLLTAAIENSTAGWTQQGPQVVNPIPAYFPTGTGPLGICGLNTPVTIAPGASASFFVHGQTGCPIFNYNFGFSPPVANGGFTLTGGTISFDVLGSGNHFNQGTANGIANINVNFAGPIVPVLIAGLASGSVFPVGVTTNTYRATDPAGNSSTCSFTVTVVDVQPPTITCPANIIRNTDPNVCTATFAPPSPTFSDNCPGVTTSWVMTGATTGSGTGLLGTKTFNLTGTTGQGITTVTYTARDASGNTSTCSFTVTINDLVIPNISAQPATKFVCIGSNGVFTVTATSNGGPLAYQWQTWDGTAWVNIVGATTSSYTVPNVSFADNTRSFRVILTGLCSIVTSNFATLYVNPLPTITLLTSIPPSLLPGQSLTITATGNPPGGTFEWFKDNVLTSHSGSTWTGLTVDDIGVYKVRYTDPNGCISTSAEVAVTGQPSKNLYVYPNPNNGAFTVRFFNDPNETATVRVYDSKGTKVYEKAELTNTAYTGIAVDLGPTISSGVYVVVVNNSAGKETGGRKIVVRKK